MTNTSASISFDTGSLKPVIEAAVEAALARIGRDREATGNKLAMSEAEAAQLLDLQPRQLRDERRRGCPANPR